jgi:hypothetical protein
MRYVRYSSGLNHDAQQPQQEFHLKLSEEITTALPT